MAKQQKTSESKDTMRIAHAVLTLAKDSLTNDVVQSLQQLNVDMKLIEVFTVLVSSSLDKLVAPVSKQLDGLV